jgi:hypothetical protein
MERMLEFYPRERPALILDATVNRGRFWAESERNVLVLDIDPRYRPDVVGDNRRQPFKDGCFDVIVYDPPHVPNQGAYRSKDFSTRFGLGKQSSSANGYNFTHLYPPFLREAFRVLRQAGVLFCKVADYIHNHRYQWAHIEVVRAAVQVGFCPSDCIIKLRKGPTVDPKWKMAHHARRQHCYWIVLRKSGRCE